MTRSLGRKGGKGLTSDMCYYITSMGLYDSEESCTFKESPLINLQENRDARDG